MTFVVDIGNSAVKWALFDGEVPVRRGREASAGPDGKLPVRRGREASAGPDGKLPVRRGREASAGPDMASAGPDEASPWIARLGSDAAGAHRAVIVSVVPALLSRVAAELNRRMGRAPLVVSSALALPFAMGYRTPATLGADRLAAAAGAVDLATKRGRNPGDLVIVDAGTALTVDRVGGGPTFLGGAIAPGPMLLASALRSGTAQLPDIAMDWPPGVIGQSTEEAIRVGVLHGFVAAAEGLITRMAGKPAGTPFVVATGGWADLLARETAVIDEVSPDLVLMGALAVRALNPD